MSPALTRIEKQEGRRQRETSLSRLLMTYITTELIFMLLPGTFLGVWNLFAISSRRAPDSISAAWVQAHGHAQIFGWIGTFVLGIGFYSIPKLRRLYRRPWNWPRSYRVASHQPDHAPSFLGDDHPFHSTSNCGFGRPSSPDVLRLRVPNPLARRTGCRNRWDHRLSGGAERETWRDAARQRLHFQRQNLHLLQPPRSSQGQQSCAVAEGFHKLPCLALTALPLVEWPEMAPTVHEQRNRKRYESGLLDHGTGSGRYRNHLRKRDAKGQDRRIR
jgi:hypothetical protein